MVSISFRARIDYGSLSCTRIDRIPLSSESLISVVSRLYGCTVWLLYGTGTVMYGYCMVLTTVWYCMVLYGYSCTAVRLYSCTVSGYGTCTRMATRSSTVWYRYYCTAVWYCMAVQLYGTSTAVLWALRIPDKRTCSTCVTHSRCSRWHIKL